MKSVPVILKMLYIMFIVCAFSGTAFAFDRTENSHYELSLGGIHVGDLALSARGSGPDMRIGATIKTGKWVSLFYEVKDSTESVLTERRRKDLPKTFMFVPRSYKVELNEGPHNISKEFQFNYDKRTIVYKDLLNNERASLAFKDLTFDPLSALYYIRQLPLEVGKSMYINVFNNKKIKRIAVQVLRKEQIKIPAGTFNTILVRSNMDDVGDGIIYYPGDIYMWLNDDEMRTPIVIEKRLNTLVEGKLPDFLKNNMPFFMKEKIKVGALRAVLTKR